MIEIKISGATPLETLASLTAFGFRCMTNEDVVAAANRICDREQKEAAKAAHAPSTPAPLSEEEAQAMVDAARSFNPGAVAETPTPPPAAPETPPAAEPPAGAGGTKVPSDPAPVKALSLEEVRDVGIKYAKKYGNPAVREILNELGVSGMGALTKKQRPVFLEKLTALGPLEEGDGNA